MREPPVSRFSGGEPPQGIIASSFNYYSAANSFWGRRSRTHNPAFDRAFHIAQREFMDTIAPGEEAPGKRFAAWIRAAYWSMLDYDGFMDSARKLDPETMAAVESAFADGQGRYIENLAYQRDNALEASDMNWAGKLGAEMLGAVAGDADPMTLATFYFGAPYRAAAATKGAWKGIGAAGSGFHRQFRQIGKRQWRGKGGIFRTAGRQAATDMAAVAALSGPAGYLDKLWLDSVGVSEDLAIAKMAERWMEVPFAGLLRGAGSLAIDAAANSRLFYRPRTESRIGWGESMKNFRFDLARGAAPGDIPPDAPREWAEPYTGPLARLTQHSESLPYYRNRPAGGGSESIGGPPVNDLDVKVQDVDWAALEMNPEELLNDLKDIGPEAVQEFFGTSNPKKLKSILTMMNRLDENEYADVLGRYALMMDKRRKAPKKLPPAFWEGRPAAELPPGDVVALAYQNGADKVLDKFMPNKKADYESVLTEMKTNRPADYDKAASAVVREIEYWEGVKKMREDWMSDQPKLRQVETIPGGKLIPRNMPGEWAEAASRLTGLINEWREYRNNFKPNFVLRGNQNWILGDQKRFGNLPPAVGGKRGGIATIETRAKVARALARRLRRKKDIKQNAVIPHPIDWSNELPAIFSQMTEKQWDTMKAHAPELWAKYFPLWHPQTRSLIKVEGGGQNMAGGGTRREVLEQIRSLGFSDAKLSAARKGAQNKVDEYRQLRLRDKAGDEEVGLSAKIAAAKKRAQRAIVRVGREELRLADEIFQKRFVRVKNKWRPRDVFTASPDARKGAVEAQISPTGVPDGAAVAETAQKGAEMLDAAFTGKPRQPSVALNEKGLENPATKMPEYIVKIKESEISIDASVYQHRAGVDKQGRDNQAIAPDAKLHTGMLGMVMVHELRDGRLMLIDGHQRVNWMRDNRLEGRFDDTELTAIVLREEDGWTAGMARENGAYMNLAGGDQRASAAWEWADFLRNKSALGQRLLDDNPLEEKFKQNYQAGILLNNFHPAALDESAKGMNWNKHWGAAMGMLADAGRKWEEALQVEAIKLFGEKFNDPKIPSSTREELLNLAHSIAANINADMAKGRAALQAKAQGGLGDILAGGNSAMFDARLNVLASFINLAKTKKRMMNALAGDVGDAVGRDIEGRVNQGQAAAKAAEMTLGEHFAIKAHHTDSAEYALVSEFAERMLGEKGISAPEAAAEMLDAYIARNKKGALKLDGRRVSEQQDTDASAAMFDVSRETSPKAPKKPPETPEIPPKEGMAGEFETALAANLEHWIDRTASAEDYVRMTAEEFIASRWGGKGKAADMMRAKKAVERAMGGGQRGAIFDVLKLKPKSAEALEAAEFFEKVFEPHRRAAKDKPPPHENAAPFKQPPSAVGVAGEFEAAMRDLRGEWQGGTRADFIHHVASDFIDGRLGVWDRGKAYEVLEMAKAGKSSAEIVKALKLKPKSVDAAKLREFLEDVYLPQHQAAVKAGDELPAAAAPGRNSPMENELAMIDKEMAGLKEEVDKIQAPFADKPITPASLKAMEKADPLKKRWTELKRRKKELQKAMRDGGENFAAGDVRGDWESSARLAAALARMFGDDAPPLAVLAEVFSSAGNRVGGRVYGGGIELAEHRAGFGLLSHESLHILQQRGVLSDDEMLALSAAGKRLAATDETIRRRLDAVDENGEKIYTGGALEWEYGALFAEHYTRASKAQRARLAGEELSVFARIVEWLEEAADILRSYFGDNTAKARLFMRRLSRGQVDVSGGRTALERSQNIIRDKDGNMAVFYHGTPESFEKYQRGRLNWRSLAGDEDQRVDLGVHFGDEATATGEILKPDPRMRDYRGIGNHYTFATGSKWKLDPRMQNIDAAFMVDGKPVVFYRGMENKADGGNMNADSSFTPFREYAEHFGEDVYPVFLAAKRVFDFRKPEHRNLFASLYEKGGYAESLLDYVAVKDMPIFDISKYAPDKEDMWNSEFTLPSWIWFEIDNGRGTIMDALREEGFDAAMMTDGSNAMEVRVMDPRIIINAETGETMAKGAENLAFTTKYENADARRAAADGLRKEGKSPQDIWTETGLVRFDGEWLAEVPPVKFNHPGSVLSVKQNFTYQGRKAEAEMFRFRRFLGGDKESLAFERLTRGEKDGEPQDLWVAVIPNLKDLLKSEATAAYSQNNHVILLDKGWLDSPKGGRSQEELQWVMSHEVQHAIDKVEGRNEDVVEFDGESFMHEIAYDFSPSERRARAASRRMLTTNLEWLPDFNIGKDGLTLPKRGLKKWGTAEEKELLSADFDLDAPKRGQLTGGEIEKRENARKREAQKDEEAGLLARKLAQGGLVSGGQSAAALRQLDMFGDNHKPIPGAEVVQKNGRWLVYHNGEPVAVKRTEAAALKAAQEYAPEKNPLFDIGGNDTYFRAGDLEIRGMDGGGYGVYKAGELEAEYEKMADAALHVERERGGNDGAAAADLFSKCMGGK